MEAHGPASKSVPVDEDDGSCQQWRVNRFEKQERNRENREISGSHPGLTTT